MLSHVSYIQLRKKPKQCYLQKTTIMNEYCTNWKEAHMFDASSFVNMLLYLLQSYVRNSKDTPEIREPC